MQCESDLEKDVDARKSQENQEYKANLMKKQPTNQEASKTKQQGIDSTRIDWQDPLVEDKDTVVYRYKSKQNPNEKEWAIKIVSTGCNKNLVKIVKEIVIGFGCNHPNILPIKRYHLNYDETHSKWEVQMKIPRVKQSLKDLLNEKINKKEPFTNQEIIEILYDIAQGLEYLHDRKIVHQDLKLANVLVSNANIMRLDIGIGAGIGDDSTNAYLAPEWREDQIAEKKGLYKMDMWSLGIIVLKLCLGSNGSSLDRIPYKKPENKEDFVMKIQTLPSQFDKHVRDLIENLLDKNPEKRMSSGGLKQKLEEMYPNIKVKRASVITSVSRESKGFNLEEKKKEILHNDKAKQNSIEKTNEEQFGNISKGNFKSQIKCAQNQNIQSINQQKHQELKEENEKLVESQKPPPGVKPVESIERTRVKEEEINKNENWKEDAL